MSIGAKLVARTTAIRDELGRPITAVLDSTMQIEVRGAVENAAAVAARQRLHITRRPETARRDVRARLVKPHGCADRIGEVAMAVAIAQV